MLIAIFCDGTSVNTFLNLKVRRCCRGGCFTFSFNISTAYPHDAPKVKCKTKVRPVVHQLW